MEIVLAIALFYCVYQLFRNEAVYRIRLRWIDTEDKRRGRYTYFEMHDPSLKNWLGLRYPKDKHFK